jgi:hypothetical protein
VTVIALVRWITFAMKCQDSANVALELMEDNVMNVSLDIGIILTVRDVNAMDILICATQRQEFALTVETTLVVLTVRDANVDITGIHSSLQTLQCHADRVLVLA